MDKGKPMTTDKPVIPKNAVQLHFEGREKPVEPTKPTEPKGKLPTPHKRGDTVGKGK